MAVSKLASRLFRQRVADALGALGFSDPGRAITITEVDENGTIRHIVSDGTFGGGYRAGWLVANPPVWDANQADADDITIAGIIQNPTAPAVGEDVTFGVGGVLKWEAGGIFGEAEELMVNAADGRCILAAGSGKFVVAFSLTPSTGAGDIVECVLKERVIP